MWHILTHNWISAFCDNKKDRDMMYESYDQLWKMRTISDKLSD